jgi:hypothetical protein
MNKKVLLSTVFLFVMVWSVLLLPVAFAAKGGKKGEPRYNVIIFDDLEGFRDNAIYGTQLNGATYTFLKPIVYTSPLYHDEVVLTDQTFRNQIAFYRGHQGCRITVRYNPGEETERLIFIFVYDADVIRYKQGENKHDIADVYFEDLAIIRETTSNDYPTMWEALRTTLTFTIYYDLIE